MYRRWYPNFFHECAHRRRCGRLGQLSCARADDCAAGFIRCGEVDASESFLAARRAGGALLIDTPGLRELQLWGAREGVERTFSDIEEMAAQCRYGNCGHTTEPGCAVQTAIAEGRLDEERVESWRKLEREQEFLRRKIDPEAQKQEKERVKLVHRGARQKYDQRRKDGGKP